MELIAIDNYIFRSVDVFHHAKSQMGGLNVVCNNAGVLVFEDEKHHSDKLISVNLVGSSSLFLL